MKRSRFIEFTCIRLVTLISVLAFTPFILFSFTSCSDPEQRLTGSDSMSTVILDLGETPADAEGPMLAQVPLGIVSVSVTVTGPGMSLISITETTIDGVRALSIPAGPARLFTVQVDTLSEYFIGTAVANLPAGVTVSVPIVMEWGGWIGPGPQ